MVDASISEVWFFGLQLNLKEPALSERRDAYLLRNTNYSRSSPTDRALIRAGAHPLTGH